MRYALEANSVTYSKGKPGTGFATISLQISGVGPVVAFALQQIEGCLCIPLFYVMKLNRTTRDSPANGSSHSDV